MASNEHPVRARHWLAIEAQLELYRERLAQLHDQVWWLSLPFWRRWLYIACGHRAPIEHFYETRGWVREFVRNELGR